MPDKIENMVQKPDPTIALEVSIDEITNQNNEQKERFVDVMNAVDGIRRFTVDPNFQRLADQITKTVLLCVAHENRCAGQHMRAASIVALDSLLIQKYASHLTPGRADLIENLNSRLSTPGEE